MHPFVFLKAAGAEGLSALQTQPPKLSSYLTCQLLVMYPLESMLLWGCCLLVPFVL